VRARSTLPGLLFALATVSALGRAEARDGASAPAVAQAAQTKDGASTDPKARERSRAAFRRGVAQLRAQDWTGARTSFEEAWSLVQHPSILLNLGIARLHTDDPVLAEQDLLRFLSEDPGAAPEELASAREALAEARSKIGTLRILVTPSTARVIVDNQPVAVRAGDAQQGLAEVRSKSGAHTVVVDADGFEPSTKPVDLAAKAETELKVDLVAKSAPTAPPKESGTRKILGWSLAGTAGAALIASGVMALRAVSLADDYEDPRNPSFQRRDVKDEGVGFRTGADVALAVGLVAGAGAVVLLFTDLGKSTTRPAAGLRHPLAFTW
jgi:hypothetical protein